MHSGPRTPRASLLGVLKRPSPFTSHLSYLGGYFKRVKINKGSPTARKYLNISFLFLLFKRKKINRKTDS
jgi:hypothetical protein